MDRWGFVAVFGGGAVRPGIKSARMLSACAAVEVGGERAGLSVAVAIVEYIEWHFRKGFVVASSICVPVCGAANGGTNVDFHLVAVSACARAALLPVRLGECTAGSIGLGTVSLQTPIVANAGIICIVCLLYTSPSPRD